MKSSVHALALFALVACDASLQPMPIVQAQGQGGGPMVGPGAGEPDGGRKHIVPEAECVGRCCPTAPECYPLGNPSPTSGAECLAVLDNTGKSRRTYRQTMSVSITPPAFAAALVAGILVKSSELQSEQCGSAEGTSGFVQLIDFDVATGVSRTGFARRTPSDLATASREGLCFVEGTYDDPPYRLPSIPVPQNWPPGLPEPMPLPWQVKTVTAKRVLQDFDLEKDRRAILARFAPGGDLAGQFNGIFYYDEARGFWHGFSPVAFIVNYVPNQQAYNAVPLREAEIKQQFNDPEHPNCAGSLLGENDLLPISCSGDSVNRLWGCSAGNCSKDELGPTSVTGYFLLTELEQLYNPLLQQTLCNAAPATNGYPGWTTSASCRSAPQWNLADPVNGLPPGDWCAATNLKGDTQCHDAWRSVSFSVFQAFPVQTGSCSAF